MRYAFPVLFALLLGTPFLMRRALMRNESGDRRPDDLRLIILTPHDDDIRRVFAVGFDDWYRRHFGRGVYIDYHMPGGTTDMIRLLSSTYAAYRNPDGSLPDNVPIGFDLVWGGGDFAYYHDLEPLGVLQPLNLSADRLRTIYPQSSLGGVRLYDDSRDANGNPAPRWLGICLSSFGIVYNPDLYRSLGLPIPKTWSSLVDPRLFGFVGVPDPTHSGSVAVCCMMVVQRSMADAEEALLVEHPSWRRLLHGDLAALPEDHQAVARGWRRGMGTLLRIAANVREFNDSSEVVPTDVARGEEAAGMSIDFYARVTERTVGSERARFVLPHAATAITPDAIAVPRGVSGERLELAMRFIDFLLSPEGQRLWIVLPGKPGGPRERSPERMPVRRDVYADQTGWAFHDNPFAEGDRFNERGDWMALMNDTLPIWAAAWIDSRPQLLETYRSILAVPDSSRRDALLAKLADVPVTMDQVAADRDERLRIERTHGDADEWKARRRIFWGDRFRRHYAAVEAEARKEKP